MDPVRCEKTGNSLTVYLSGRIDSGNAAAVEAEIIEARADASFGRVVLDCTDLVYISSAGLRVILRLRKEIPDTSAVNVPPEVYEIFEMTGFTEMMEVRRAYRTISVADCDVIGRGANAKVCRIDRDTIVKVFFNPDALEDVRRERELARTAFKLGVPTAIPFDVVKIREGGYGAVFELLNAKTFAELLISGERTVDEIAAETAAVMRAVHATELRPGILPDMRKIARERAIFLKDHLPAAQGEKLLSLIDAMPENNHMLHGDLQIKNVMVQNGESLLIDMDTICTGDPVFEFAGLYAAYLGYSEADHDNPMQFFGLPCETITKLWDGILSACFAGKSEAYIRSAAEKAALVGSCRILWRTLRLNTQDTEYGRKLTAACRRHIAELTEKVDALPL